MNPTNDAIELKVRKLKTIMDKFGDTRLDVLKLDIEGSEYGVIDDIIAEEIDVKQILVEIHHENKMNMYVEKLSDIGYNVIYSKGRNFSLKK